MSDDDFCMMIWYSGVMRALSVELEDDLVDVLEAERELFGFESRQAYVRWIIEHRGSIEAEQTPGHDSDRDRLLAEHSDRLSRLEKRVATISSTADRDGVAATDRTKSDGEPATDADTTNSDSDGNASDEHRGCQRQPDETSKTTPQTPGSVLEVRGSPRTVRHGPSSTDQQDDASTNTAPGDQPPSSSEDGTDDGSATKPERTATTTSTLSPERVARIPEDPVMEDAGVLGTVESERLDELSRRAVATTRKRLNREIQTGLEYTASTQLAEDGIRPGEDLADLEALSIPGRSAERLEERRRAVGRALAYVRDEGSARRSDFVEALYSECPAGYETADGWWRCIKAGLKQIDCVDGGEGARVWRYRR